MQPDPKNTALKTFQLVGRTDPWTKISIPKTVTTGGLDLQYYKGKSLHTACEEQNVPPFQICAIKVVAQITWASSRDELWGS